MDAVAPPLGRRTRLPKRVEARGERRAVVGMLTGCVQREFFPDVNAATARVLAMEGCDVVIPVEQGCCGALSVHNGRHAEAQGFARALIDAFSDAGVEKVVVNSAGCGSSMKEYAELLADDEAYADRATAFAERVRDVTEVLADLGPVAERHPLDVTVAYHDACPSRTPRAYVRRRASSSAPSLA
jgi:glycolate oxidase iron-sulfur subunit